MRSKAAYKNMAIRPTRAKPDPIKTPLEECSAAPLAPSASCALTVKVKVALLAKEAGQLVVYLWQMIRVSAMMSQRVAVAVWQLTTVPVGMIVVTFPLWVTGGHGTDVLQQIFLTLVRVHEDFGHQTDVHSHSSSSQCLVLDDPSGSAKTRAMKKTANSKVYFLIILKLRKSDCVRERVLVGRSEMG